MTIIFSSLYFIAICFLLFYLPGKWVIQKVHYKSINTVASITLNIGIGLCMFLVATYALAWLHVSYLYVFAVLPIIFLELPHCIRGIVRYFSIQWLFCFESLLCFFGILLMVSATFFSGIEKNTGLVFYGVNALDGIFHIALIRNMVFQFPPSYPGLSNSVLQGYHILYDFLISQFSLLFAFSAFDLYFRFFSVFTACFYGLSGITLAYSLRMNTLTRRIFLFLLFFAQGGELFIFHWFRGAYILFNSGIVQPAGNIVDPSVLLSVSLVFLLFVVLFTTKRNQLILPILLLGIIPGIKIYAGILVYTTIGVIALVSVFHRKWTYFFIVIFAGLLSALVYLPFNFKAGSLIYSPFLFFRHFMESDLVLASFQWPLKLQVYELHRNIPRIISLYALALLFYIIPPLGLRLFIAIKIKKIFSRKFYTLKNIFWISFISIGFLIPIFFIQSIAVFNTVQFYWIIWIVLLIPTAFCLTSLIKNPTAIKNILLFLFVIAFSLPVVQFPIGIYQRNGLTIDNDLLHIMQQVHTAIPHSATILAINREYQNNHYTNLYGVPLLAALSGRPMYLEPEQAEFSKVPLIEQKRQKVVDTIVYNLSTCSNVANNEIKNILESAHVQYILLLKDSTCVTKLRVLQMVTQKGTYSLFRVL